MFGDLPARIRFSFWTVSLVFTYLKLFSNVGPECGIGVSNGIVEDNFSKSLHIFEMFFHFLVSSLHK